MARSDCPLNKLLINLWKSDLSDLQDRREALAGLKGITRRAAEDSEAAETVVETAEATGVAEAGDLSIKLQWASLPSKIKFPDS